MSAFFYSNINSFDTLVSDAVLTNKLLSSVKVVAKRIIWSEIFKKMNSHLTLLQSAIVKMVWTAIW